MVSAECYVAAVLSLLGYGRFSEIMAATDIERDALLSVHECSLEVRGVLPAFTERRD